MTLKISFQASEKLKMILNIWQSGYGVVSLHLFHNVIPVEAYTREACMIEALGKYKRQLKLALLSPPTLYIKPLPEILPMF